MASKPPVKTLEGLLKRIRDHIADLTQNRYTGKFTIDVHMRQGGIGAVFIHDAKQMV